MATSKTKKSTRVTFGKRHIEVVGSTLVDKVFYSTKQKVLDALFHNGSRYRYRGVTPSVFSEFVLSGSMGKFFNQNIKGRYESEKVRVR